MKNKLPHLITHFLYLVLLVSTLCAFRAITSIGIGLLFAASLFWNKFRKIDGYLVACTLFVLLQLTGLSSAEGWKHVQLKSSILFIPLCFYCYPYINRPRFQILMKQYVWLLVLALSYCLLMAFYKYQFQQAGATVFFYHELVSPFSHHAIQYSILVFAGFIFLVESAHQKMYVINRFVHFCLLAFLTGCILLLSSKLVIGFLAAYLLLLLFHTINRNTSTRYAAIPMVLAGLLLTGFVVCSPNPVGRRFQEILRGNIRLVQQPSFSPADYFNGLQFRLLQWRFTAELLNEHHAWLSGVSPAAAQPLLDKKYIATKMYTGQSGRPGRGYLGLNTHNQFLESLLQTGLPGLLCFMAICFSMIRMAVQQKNRAFSVVVALLIAYAFTESVFETQYGIMVFIFIPLLFYYGCRKES